MKMLIVSNMYPNDKNPSYGVFVKNFVEMCEEEQGVVINKIVMHKSENLLVKTLAYIKYYFLIFSTLLLKNEYDLVYVHYAGQNSLPFFFLTKIKNFNLIFNLHGSDVFSETKIHKLFSFFTKRVLKKCNKVVVPSKYYNDIVSEYFNVLEDNIIIFPSSGINENVFYPLNKTEARKTINITSSYNTKIVGFVGRIEHGKGWDVLLNCIKKMHDDGTINPNDFKFVFIGDGKEVVKFNKRIIELSIKDYVCRLKAIPQKDLTKYYNSFDVFCFPTMRRSESLGLVGIEALACGTPVIASDFAAPKYYIEEGKNGFKFEMGNYSSLANKIQYYFTLEEQIKQRMKRDCISTSTPYIKSEIREILTKKILEI